MVVGAHEGRVVAEEDVERLLFAVVPEAVVAVPHHRGRDVAPPAAVEEPQRDRLAPAVLHRDLVAHLQVHLEKCVYNGLLVREYTKVLQLFEESVFADEELCEVRAVEAVDAVHADHASLFGGAAAVAAGGEHPCVGYGNFF